MRAGPTTSLGLLARLVFVMAAAAMAAARLVRTVARVHEVQRFSDKNIVVDFGKYAATDPVLGMAEDFMQEGVQGFPEHPHRGFETVTLVLKGRLRHRDSTGHADVLEAGAVVWMTAGSGIIHSEFPDGPELCHALQIWYNLPAAHKMTPPAYQQFSREALPVVRADGGVAEVTVMAGQHAGVRGPVKNIVPATCLVARVKAGTSVALDLPASHNAFLYVLEGAGRFGASAHAVSAGHVAWFDPVASAADGGTAAGLGKAAGLGLGPVTADTAPAADSAGLSVVPITADTDLHVLLFGGEPIREPVFHQGPFVLHTREALQQAFRDYQTGRFVQ